MSFFSTVSPSSSSNSSSRSFSLHPKNGIFEELSLDIQKHFSAYEKWVNESTSFYDSKKTSMEFALQTQERKEEESKQSLLDDSETSVHTQISVSSMDTLSFLHSICSSRPSHELGKVCILNMASDFKPGGGVEKGSQAQEEDLCRRTDLFVALKPHFPPFWTLRRKQVIRYPLPQDRPVAIYTKNVTLYKDVSLNDYEQDNFYSCDVISMPALRKPILNAQGKMNETDLQCMREKIQYMLEVCLAEKCNTLVLGAFGCGAFGNNPHQVAQLFHQVLHSKRYQHSFRYVFFAVLDLARQKVGNYSIFSKTFGSYIP